MRKTTTIRTLLVMSVLCLFLINEVSAQVAIGMPNLGFTRACAGDSFNEYNATFVFTPENEFNTSNQFKVEMSDANGSFANPDIVFTSGAGEITTSPATVTFSIPKTTAGEGYKIRIKSTAPAVTSSSSAVFAAYYKIQDSPFSINNLVSTGSYCAGGSYLLTIDNPGNELNDSPLKYPSLTFKWYKETGPTTSVYVGAGSSFSVSQEGTYFVKTNYGSCTSNSFSNRVTISENTGEEAVATIVSSKGNVFCPSDGNTVLNTIAGTSYQWFKDGDIIAGATNQSFETSDSGTYSVQVNLGGCSASGSLTIESQGFKSSINVGDVESIVLGQSLTVMVTTDAADPQYMWYYNGQLINEANGESYDATEFGDYIVVVTQTDGCILSQEFNFTINEKKELFPDVAKIPNLISPNGDGINDTWILPKKYVSGTNTEVIIMTNQGKVVFQTNDYMNNWPEASVKLNSVNDVFYYILTTSNQEVKKGSITVVK